MSAGDAAGLLANEQHEGEQKKNGASSMKSACNWQLSVQWPPKNNWWPVRF